MTSDKRLPARIGADCGPVHFAKSVLMLSSQIAQVRAIRFSVGSGCSHKNSFGDNLLSVHPLWRIGGENFNNFFAIAPKPTDFEF